MFRDIVSNLSFSPSANTQLTYYWRRLKKEHITRTLSLVMAIGLVVVQVATIIAPADPANASGGANNIIKNGINTANHPQKTLLSLYDKDPELQAIYKHYHITREDIDRTHDGSVSTSDGDLVSLGRNHVFADDDPTKVGNTTYYWRRLSWWGKGQNLPALEGTRKYDGARFYVIYDCGNLVIETGVPKPKPTPAPKPKNPHIEITKAAVSPAANSNVKPGDTITYKITYRNTGEGAATNVLVADRISNDTAFVSSTTPTGATVTKGQASHGTLTSGFYVDAHIAKLNPGASGSYNITVKVNNLTKNQQFCNAALIDADGQTAVYSNKVCHNVVITPNKPVTPVTPVTPDKPVTPVTPVTPTNPNISQAKAGLLTSAADGISSDANGATAQAGDTIEYSLTTTNIGTGAAKDYVVTESLGDVLEYADVIGKGGGTLTGGTLTWPPVTIEAGKNYVTTFKVQVKNPIPTTPRSSIDPASYDLKMSNVYGNLVNVNLTVPPEKQVEVATETLPATGAGTNMIVLLLTIAGITYFYFRNRQMVTEVSMLRGDHHGHGGIK